MNLPTPSARRRHFIGAACALGAGLFGRGACGAGEPAPESTRLRLVHSSAICLAPQYVAEALYPVAAKRALRAILKAADICAEQPEYVARYLQQKGIEPRYDVSLDVLMRLPYHHWRDWNVEDTLRFHALRLKDVGMIQSAPNDLIERCTDQRFLVELKRELRA